MDIGNAIKLLRKRKDISQKELSNLCGISANALCSIESGGTFPSKSIHIIKYATRWKFRNLICYYSAFLKRIFHENKRILYKTLCESIKEDLIQNL